MEDLFNNLIDNHEWDDNQWKQEASCRHVNLKHFERLLRNNPPLHILESIHEQHPKYVQERFEGGIGRPLHLLATHGASAESLSFVANAFNPVEITDENGNTPIDLILDKAWDGREEEQRRSVLELLKLKDRSGFDTVLTGLPNKAILNKYGHRLMPGCNSPSVMIVFLDLFGFKAINDELGDKVGDLAIKFFADKFGSISQSIVKQYNVNAHVFRYQYGDEFVMLFLMDPEREDAKKTFQDIYKELKNESCIANVRWSSKDNDIGSIPRCGFCYSDKVSTAEGRDR